MIRSRSEVTVRYAETDMMGIVYHANYLPWFEIGRTQLLKEVGIPYRELEAEGYRLPVLEVSAKYLRPALYDDTLTIVTTLREKPLLRIRLEYEVRRGEELLATGATAHAFVDREGRPLRPPAWVAEKLSGFQVAEYSSNTAASISAARARPSNSSARFRPASCRTAQTAWIRIVGRGWEASRTRGSIRAGSPELPAPRQALRRSPAYFSRCTAVRRNSSANAFRRQLQQFAPAQRRRGGPGRQEQPAADAGETIPRTNLQADVASINASSDSRPQLAWNDPAVFDRLVGNAPP